MDSLITPLSLIVFFMLLLPGLSSQNIDLNSAKNKLNEAASGVPITSEDNIIEENIEDVFEEAGLILDSTSFRETISNGWTFVKFYAPWCPHCVQMAPEWNELSEYFHNEPLEGVAIAEVDCTSSETPCFEEEVDSYPTVKLYKDGQLFKDYYWSRDFETMKKFVNEEIRGSKPLKPDAMGIFTLQDFSWEKFHKDAGKTPVVVKFYVPGCQHCSELEPTYQTLAVKFLLMDMEDVMFAEVNCLDKDSLDTCTDEAIDEFPSIYMYKDGEADDIYSGDRSLKDLSNFVYETVDPDQVERDDPMGLLFANMGFNDDEDDDLSEEDNHAPSTGTCGGGKVEAEECNCGEPDCDCDDEDDDEEEEEDDDDDIGEKGEKDDVEETNDKHVKTGNSGKRAEIDGEEVEIKDQGEKTKNSNEESEQRKHDSGDIHTEL